MWSKRTAAFESRRKERTVRLSCEEDDDVLFMVKYKIYLCLFYVCYCFTRTYPGLKEQQGVDGVKQFMENTLRIIPKRDERKSRKRGRDAERKEEGDTDYIFFQGRERERDRDTEKQEGEEAFSSSSSSFGPITKSPLVNHFLSPVFSSRHLFLLLLLRIRFPCILCMRS